jgi:carboxyl-terminal processing protease
LKDLLYQEPNGLIIDLRNNSGGLVETSIEITSLFITDNIVMIEEWGDGSRKEYRSTGNPLASEIPLVTLVNEGSASASEITAGALQDLGRSRLVGTPTFGKGYIQNWLSLRDNNGGLRITTARWLTPKGRQIQGMGLQPDFLIQITEEDFNNRSDPQLDLAIKILSQRT